MVPLSAQLPPRANSAAARSWAPHHTQPCVAGDCPGSRTAFNKEDKAWERNTGTEGESLAWEVREQSPALLTICPWFTVQTSPQGAHLNPFRLDPTPLEETERRRRGEEMELRDCLLLCGNSRSHPWFCPVSFLRLITLHIGFPLPSERLCFPLAPSAP